MKNVTCSSILILLLLTSSAFAQFQFEIFQDTWEDGPGYPGPYCSDVTWGDGFDTCSVIDWWSNPGQLRMGRVYQIEPDSTGIVTDLKTYHLCVIDVDDDGDSDAVCIKSNSDSALILLMNIQGTGAEWQADTAAFISGYTSNLDVGDINCDGLPDIAVTLWDEGGVIWYENSGDSTTWMEHTVSPYPELAAALHCCDYDGDGDVDLIAGSGTQDDVRLFTNLDGLGTVWGCTVLPESCTDCRDISSADIDNDGDLDLMGVFLDDEDIVWWENDEASGSWDIHWIESNFQGAWTLSPADIDGDGDVDIAASGYTTGWWENQNGSGTSWIRHTVDDGNGTYDLSASDADGDGDIDLLGCITGIDDIVAIWEQSGDEWIRHCIFTGSDPLTCTFSDMDGDGKQDITATWSWSPSRIAWFEYTTYGFIGWLESSILEVMIPTDYEYVHWGIIDWIATVPPGTSVMFQMREGNSPSNMGPWTGYITTPGTQLQGYLTGEGYLAQYRVTLVTTDPDTIPVLEQMMVSYEPLGGVSSENSDQPGLYIAGSNPCHGEPVLQCVLNCDGPITLSIWDMAGRLVSQPAADAHMLTGTHLMQTGELEPGIYFCRLETSGFSESLRLVVLD